MIAAEIATLNLYHFKEKFSNPEKIHEDILKICPDYTLLQDVANSFKHTVLDQKKYKKRKPLISGRKDIREYIVSSKFRDHKGSYSNQEKEITIFLVDGSIRDLLEVMINVLNAWGKILFQMGYHKSQPPLFPYEKRRHLLREESSAVSLLSSTDYTIGTEIRFYIFYYPLGIFLNVRKKLKSVDFTHVSDLSEIPDGAKLLYDAEKHKTLERY
ncbi:hypothetical protein [Larkinella sp.]|uniref:hypothetical protein n=1 Tax=Larkinella sp. TaxID=2034517 RepID=UPI003BA96B29